MLHFSGPPLKTMVKGVGIVKLTSKIKKSMSSWDSCCMSWSYRCELVMRLSHTWDIAHKIEDTCYRNGATCTMLLQSDPS